MGLTGAGFPDLDAARVAFALKFLALVNSAMFFRGLVRTTARDTFLLGALSTALMASDLSSGDSGAHGVPLLSNSNLPMPASPLLGGSEHPTTAAHVAEGSLARPVGATSPHPWDPM